MKLYKLLLISITCILAGSLTSCGGSEKKATESGDSTYQDVYVPPTLDDSNNIDDTSTVVTVTDNTTNTNPIMSLFANLLPTLVPKLETMLTSLFSGAGTSGGITGGGTTVSGGNSGGKPPTSGNSGSGNSGSGNSGSGTQPIATVQNTNQASTQTFDTVWGTPADLEKLATQSQMNAEANKVDIQALPGIQSIMNNGITPDLGQNTQMMALTSEVPEKNENKKDDKVEKK